MARIFISAIHPTEQWRAFSQKKGTAGEILDDAHLKVKGVREYAAEHPG